MSEVTRVLAAVLQGDVHAGDELLPLVTMSCGGRPRAQDRSEKPGQTLQATALVHEAYLRGVGVEKAEQWDSRRHSSRPPPRPCAASCVDQARHKQSIKGGGAQEGADRRGRLSRLPRASRSRTSWPRMKHSRMSRGPHQGPTRQTALLHRYLSGGDTAQLLDISPATAALLGSCPLLALRKAARRLRHFSPLVSPDGHRSRMEYGWQSAAGVFAHESDDFERREHPGRSR